MVAGSVNSHLRPTHHSIFALSLVPTSETADVSRNPSVITALEIIEVLEGGIELVEKENVTGDAIQQLLHLAESKLREVFNVSLADLLSQQQEKEHILLFDI